MFSRRPSLLPSVSSAGSSIFQTAQANRFSNSNFKSPLIAFDAHTVIELGAGAALPSLLLSTLPGPTPSPPSLVVATDYPDPIITNNLASNIFRNLHLVSSGCHLVARGHEWGAPVDDLL
jgi:hypothetical protein